MMKKTFILTILLLVLPYGLSAGIVNNSGTTAEDSLTVIFYALDSTGNIVAMASGDSVFFRVFYPSGGLAFEDSASYNGSRITAKVRHGLSTYSWKEAVADIDGNPRDGLYSYQLIVHDKSAADLWTPHQGEFQLYQSENFSVQFDRLADSLQGVIDSLQSQYTWVAQQMNTYDTIARLLADSSVAMTGTSRTWNLQKLHVRASGNDTALVLQGSGSGYGMIARGGPNGGVGGEFRGFGVNGYGLSSYSDSSHGTLFASNMDGAYAFYARGSGGASGAFFSGEDSLSSSNSGTGMVISSVNSDALRITGGSGQGRNAVKIVGGSDPTSTGQDAVRIAAIGINAAGLSVTSDSSSAANFSGRDTAVIFSGGIVDIVGNISGYITPTDTNLSGDTLARLTDSITFRGSGGTLDSTTIARSVWNTPSTNHLQPGTFGKYLDTEISGLSSGSGAYSVSIVTYDSSVNQTVNNVSVTVRDLSQSGLIAVGQSGTSGIVNLNLNAANYLVTAFAPGYIFNPFDTLVISGGTTDTIVGFQFDPGSPGLASLTRLYGYLYDVSGKAEAGAVVMATLPQGVTRSGNIIVSPFPVSSVSDSSGYFYLDLIPSDSLVGTNIKYEITINRTNGTLLRKRIQVPALTNWQLTW